MAKPKQQPSAAPVPATQAVKVLRTFKCSTSFVPPAVIELEDEGMTFEEIVNVVANLYLQQMGVNSTPYTVEVVELVDDQPRAD